MVKFTANSDPSTGTGDIVLNTFDDLNAKGYRIIANEVLDMIN